MSPDLPEDDLERRLRDVLHDRGLGVPAAPDALDRVHAGARRRQRRRSAGAVLGAVAIIGAAAAGISLRPHAHPAAVVADQHTASSSVSAFVSQAPPPGLVSESPGSVVSPGILASTGVTVASTPPTEVFNPVSVSAVGVNDYWVLGYTSSPDGEVATTVVRTTDGGQHFTKVGSPSAFVAQSPAKLAPDAITVADVRFGDTDNGWAYGDGLFQTSDGGASWSQLTDVPGGVVELVAANGTAWAVVDLSSRATSSDTTAHYALYSTKYGKTQQHWTPVQLPIDLGATQPSIVDQDGTVTVLASGPSRSSNRDHALVASAGGAFTDRVGPCSQDLGGYLSNSAAGIWAVCSTGHMAGVAVSTDRGASWKTVPNLPPPSFPDPGRGGVGAIDDTHALVYDFATTSLVRVTVGSSPVPVTSGPTAVGVGTLFIGFTTPSIGFVVAAQESATRQLWRTADGGTTWAMVNIGA
jgi:hypothetical protein